MRIARNLFGQISSLSSSKRNIVANYANFTLLGVLNFLISPHLLSHLGVIEFGLWKTSLRYLEFASTADGRSSQALKWIIAFSAGRASGDRNRRSVGASLFIWLCCVPILLLVLGLIIYIVPHAMHGLTAGQFILVRWTCTILAANVILAAILGLPDAVLTGSNQGFRSMNINSCMLIITNIAMVLAVFYGSGIISLAVITFLGAVMSGFLTWRVARRRISWWGIERPARDDVRSVWGFTGWTMAWSFVQLLLLSTELLLIAYLLGAGSVTAYTFTSYGVQFALSMCLLTTSAVTPGIAALLGREAFLEAGAMVKQTREIVLGIATLAGAGVLLYNRAFVTLWAGSESFMGSGANAGMVVAFVQLALIRCEAQMQDAGLKISLKVALGAVGSFFALGLGWLAYRVTGSVEMLFVGICLGRAGISIMFPVFVNRLYRLQSFPMLRLMAVGALLAACFMLGLFLNIGSWVELILTALISLVFLVPIVLVTVLSSTARRRLASVWLSGEKMMASEKQIDRS